MPCQLETGILQCTVHGRVLEEHSEISAGAGCIYLLIKQHLCREPFTLVFCGLHSFAVGFQLKFKFDLQRSPHFSTPAPRHCLPFSWELRSWGKGIVSSLYQPFEAPNSLFPRSLGDTIPLNPFLIPSFSGNGACYGTRPALGTCHEEAPVISLAASPYWAWKRAQAGEAGFIYRPLRTQGTFSEKGSGFWKSCPSFFPMDLLTLWLALRPFPIIPWGDGTFICGRWGGLVCGSI